MSGTSPQAIAREILERVQRDVLARLVEPHRLFLEVRRVKVDALRASAQDDLSVVEALFEAVSAGDPQMPGALATTLGEELVDADAMLADKAIGDGIDAADE